MGELRKYEMVVNGMTTVLRLTDADAKARGLSVPTEQKQAPRPANKARTPRDKG